LSVVFDVRMHGVHEEEISVLPVAPSLLETRPGDQARNLFERWGVEEKEMG